MGFNSAFKGLIVFFLTGLCYCLNHNSCCLSSLAPVVRCHK